MVCSKLTLTYFDLCGRGELSRLIFTFGGVAYEDKRIDFPAFPALQSTLPLGQLPVLDVDGQTYCQSGAIQRYAAKVSGLYPEDPVEALRADMIVETLSDILTTCVDTYYVENDSAVQAVVFKTLKDETVPKHFGMLESIVQGKYFAGDKISFADLQLFNVVQNALGLALPELSLDAYPKLAATVAAVKKDPKIAPFVEKQ